MKYLNQSRKKPSLKEVRDFEQSAGTSVNSDFIKFLDENNGGVPRKPFFLNCDKKYFVQCLYPMTSEIKPNILTESSQDLLSAGYANIGIIRNSLLALKVESGEIFLYDYEDFEFLSQNIFAFAENLVGEEAPADDLISQIGSSGDIELLKLFIEAGHNINERTDEGESIITIAAINSDLGLVKACVEMGADVSKVAKALRNVANFSFLRALRDEGILE